MTKLFVKEALEKKLLSSEFNEELGALLRRLGLKVMNEPTLRHEGAQEALDHIERAIITLVALHIKLQQELNP